MDDEREQVAEVYADYFAENSIDFEADMAQLIESLWPPPPRDLSTRR